MKLKATFKVHKVDGRGLVNGKATEERVLLHPIDPHELGTSDFHETTRSGLGQIKWVINKPEALGKFQVGQLVEVSFDIPK